ncbi:MAG TPA: peptidoglycan DD-metalloendopeptidase family protein [Trueperaceae bacterium]|nr:peptidoglycan DD-metalloendopeptidase family protein [Trueperaceae bacterium]
MLLLVFGVVLGLATAQVDLNSDVRQGLEDDILEYEALLRSRAQELEDIQDALGDTAAALAARIAERDSVSSELVERRRERELVEAQIAELDARRVETEGRITVLNGRLGEMATRVSELLVNLYKQRGSRLSTGLSRTDSFHDLRVRNYYLGLLAEQDATVIGELDSLVYALQMEQASLDEQLTNLRDAESRLLAVETELAATGSRLARIVEELNATQQGQLAQRQDMLTEQARIEQSLGDLDAQLEAEIARLRQVEAEQRAAAAQYAQDRERQIAAQREADLARNQLEVLTEPLAPLSTGFIRPVEDARLLTRYGESSSGVNIQASLANAAVRAVGPGIVVAVSYLGANLGYMVGVLHGSDLVTVYVNLRPPVVQANQSVTQGQVLGYLGGGTLTPNDVLQFYARRGSGASGPYVDPAPLLGW